MHVQSVPQLLSRVTRLCPLPVSLQRLMALLNDESAKLVKVVEALGTDPVLANQVMRVANSSVFGRSRKVADLRQAIVTIGLAELHAMASGMALVGAFRSTDPVSLQIHEQSLLAANVARLLARGQPVEGATAFLCGLLSEIGALACVAVDPDGFTDIWQRTMMDWDGQSPEAWRERTRLETRRYGGSTPHIGAQLLNRNALPGRIADAVESTIETPAAVQSSLGLITTIARTAGAVLLRGDRPADTETARMLLLPLEETLKRIPITDEAVVNALVEVTDNLPSSPARKD